MYQNVDLKSFLVLSMLMITTDVLSASLPLRRNHRDSDILQRHYEDLITTRQIRNSFGSSASEEESSKPAPTEEPAGSLKFHEKPPSQMVVAIYDRLELVCTVSGTPPPAVYWLKNGHPIRESPFDMEESTNRILETESLLPTRGLASTKSRLVVDCVDGDAEAIYTCVAESVSEKIVSSTYVHIEGEAPYNESTCSLKHEPNSLPAVIFMWSGTYIDVEGKDAILLCRVAGNPSARITWFDNEDKKITNGFNYQVLSTGDLKIHHLRWKDHMGLFRCRAENEFGEDESTTFVYPVVPES